MEQRKPPPVVRDVVENADVLAACPPPTATTVRGFPQAQRRPPSRFAAAHKSSSTSSPSSTPAPAPEPDPSVSGVSAPDWDVEYARVVQENVERVSRMSEDELAAHHAELKASVSSKTLALLERRRLRAAAASAAPTTDTASAPRAPPAAPPAAGGAVMLSSGDRHLLLPPVEHDKLAWTDPEAPQQPRPLSTDFSRSLRVQAMRFDLSGQPVTADLEARVDTYSAGLHHHGEEPHRAGYTLDELQTLLCSRNDGQNAMALNVTAQLLCRIRSREAPFEALLYPEAPTRSMTVGEGVVWELLAVQWPVALRVALAKKALSTQALAWEALECAMELFADANRHVVALEAVFVVPSAPLFEDDGSDEMERLDGVRVLVRQLDVVPVLLAAVDALPIPVLRCLVAIAGHSVALARVLIAADARLLERLSALHIGGAGTNAVATELALRVLRLLVSADQQYAAHVERAGVAALVFRHLLAGATASVRLEASLLLRCFVVYGLQIGPFVDVLPEVLMRVTAGTVEPAPVFCVAEAATVWLRHDTGLLNQVAALLRAPFSSHVLRLATAIVALEPHSPLADGVWAQCVVPNLAAACSDPACRTALLRMALLRRPDCLLPQSLWLSSGPSFGPPQVRSDAVNRFRTQRRLAELVRDRAAALEFRAYCLAGLAATPLFAGAPLDWIALFGRAVDCVGCLAVAGADEWLCLTFVRDAVLAPAMIQAVTDQLSPPTDDSAARESQVRARELSAHAWSAARHAFFPDADTLVHHRSRALAGELEGCDPHRALEHLFASRGDDLTGSTFLGADWVWALLKSPSAVGVRAALQLVLLCEACGTSSAFGTSDAGTNVLRLLALFRSAHAPFRDDAVSAVAAALLHRYAALVDGPSFGSGSADEHGVSSPLQAATDLVEIFVAEGNRSALLVAFLLFFMRTDLPPDFRILTWSHLGGCWKTVRVEAGFDWTNHLQPRETHKTVLGLMEDALRSGALTPAVNRAVYWLAVHHVAGAWSDATQPQWPRDQLLSRLENSQPRAAKHVQWYAQWAAPRPFPPPTSADGQ